MRQIARAGIPRQCEVLHIPRARPFDPNTRETEGLPGPTRSRSLKNNPFRHVPPVSLRYQQALDFCRVDHARLLKFSLTSTKLPHTYKARAPRGADQHDYHTLLGWNAKAKKHRSAAEWVLLRRSALAGATLDFSQADRNFSRCNGWFYYQFEKPRRLQPAKISSNPGKQSMLRSASGASTFVLDRVALLSSANACRPTQPLTMSAT